MASMDRPSPKFGPLPHAGTAAEKRDRARRRRPGDRRRFRPGHDAAILDAPAVINNTSQSVQTGLLAVQSRWDYRTAAPRRSGLRPTRLVSLGLAS